MNEYSIKQFWFEFETWRRLLENIQNENIYLKNRLAQIIKEESTNELLDDIEHYHNILLTEDSNIALLRNDVASQESWIRREVFEENATIKEILKTHKKLRKEIELFEQKFNKLKFEFNAFFSEKRIR
ncbi:MAG: hypothetical protein FGM46_06490 [Ferruginibacter sp.]|nr:hypothetical protein [Ferruginibacter sp.]